MKVSGIALAACFLFTGGSLLADDVTAPEITAISISPTGSDVSSGNATITVTVQTTDDLSGTESGNLYFYDGNGDYVRAAYFDSADRTVRVGLDDTYVLDVDIPQYSQPGTWRADARVFDVAENQRNFGPDDEPFPVPADPQFAVANSGSVDTAPPTVSSFSLSESTVVSGPASTAVTVTIHCGDALSGLSSGAVHVFDPTGQLVTGLIQYFGAYERISGDSHDGVYQVTVTLPPGVAAGTWHFFPNLTDNLGNYFQGSEVNLLVTSTSAANLALARALDAVQYTWDSNEPVWIAQTDETSDGVDAAASAPIGNNGESILQTAVTGPGTLRFDWKVDSEENQDFLSVEVADTSEYHDISGDSGWLTQSVTIPAGEHAVIWRYAKNASGSSGADRGWVDRVRFEGGSDTTLPVLQAVRISPRPVNIFGGPEDVTIEVEVADDFNGISEGRVHLINPNGDEYSSTTFDVLSRTDGDKYLGSYQVALQVPGAAVYGLWRVQVDLTENVTTTTVIHGEGQSSFPDPGEETLFVWDGFTGDVKAPVVKELAVNPSNVEVSAAAATVTVTARITDAAAGFQDGNFAIHSAEDDWTGSVYFTGGDRISGDGIDGIYQVRLQVPRYGPAGTWRVSCHLRDNLDNEREYPIDTEFSPTIDETFSVTNGGLVDTGVPEVTSIEITPGTVDASSGPATIGIDVTLSDDLSGFRDACLFFFDSLNVEQEGLFTVLDGSNRTSGNDVNGTYHVSRPLPQGSAEGQWLVRVFLRDRVGRTRLYGPGDAAYPEISDGFFTVGPVPDSLFQVFLDQYSLAGNDALPGTDTDHDGRNNATELMLGTDPTDASDSGTALITVTRDGTAMHLDFMIDPALMVGINGVFLELSDGSGGPPLRVTGQTQAGLGGVWTNVLPVNLSGSAWRITVPFSGGTSGFARLLIENP
jgi:hypothetical protein